jgi:hypothetical protein
MSTLVPLPHPRPGWPHRRHAEPTAGRAQPRAVPDGTVPLPQRLILWLRVETGALVTWLAGTGSAPTASAPWLTPDDHRPIRGPVSP